MDIVDELYAIAAWLRESNYLRRNFTKDIKDAKKLFGAPGNRLSDLSPVNKPTTGKTGKIGKRINAMDFHKAHRANETRPTRRSLAIVRRSTGQMAGADARGMNWHFHLGDMEKLNARERLQKELALLRNRRKRR